MMLHTPLAAEYRPVRLSAKPVADELRELVEPYQAIIAAQFRAILARTERHRARADGIYPWIDTKLDLTTGEDFPHDHPWLGQGVVSGWVQGRGLEGLAAFGMWLAPHADDPEVAALLARVRMLVQALSTRVRAVRHRNGGHLYFAMTPEGVPFDLDEALNQAPVALDAASPGNYSDLFAAKGLYAAAHFMRDTDATQEARAYCLAVYEDILAGRFRSDQPQPASLSGLPTFRKLATLDSVVRLLGGFSHGPYMIALGMAALFTRHEPGPGSTEMGLRLARRVLYGHVNLDGRWPMLRAHDVVEFIDAKGRPARDTLGRIISDPGHALEFVGLFLKFSAAVQRSGAATLEQMAELRHMGRLMSAILARAFGNGFRPVPGGIIKSLDLLTRRAIDDTMPWWSLPETIRAALAAEQVAPTEGARAACRRIVACSHNAFVEHYLRPDVHLMAVKLRDAQGRVSDIVPAYPDADPGYHTALSLLDALAILAGD